MLPDQRRKNWCAKNVNFALENGNNRHNAWKPKNNPKAGDISTGKRGEKRVIRESRRTKEKEASRVRE